MSGDASLVRAALRGSRTRHQAAISRVVKVTFGVLLATASAARGAPFELDPGFADAGRLVLAPPTIARGVALQSSGDVILLTQDAGGIALRRLSPDGAIDGSFGSDGLVALDDPAPTSGRPLDLKIQSDDRIVLGWIASTGDLVVRRLLPDGASDATFGAEGTTIVSLPNSACTPGACRQSKTPMALDELGRIAVATGVREPASGGAGIALVRLTSAGDLDATFGSAGLAVTDAPADAEDVVAGLAIAKSGRLLIAASRVSELDGAAGIVLAAFTADGVPDPAFVNGGRAFVAVGGLTAAADVALDPKGRIVIAGTIRPTARSLSDVLVARFLASGARDRSFGAQGVARARADRGWAAEEPYARFLLVTSSSQIIVAGVWRPLAGSPCFHMSSGLLVDFTARGGAGAVVTPGLIEVSAGLALQPDGRILVAGTMPSSCGGAGPRAAFSRLLALPVADDGSGPIRIRPGGGARIPLRR